jgi:hypothetical protein
MDLIDILVVLLIAGLVAGLVYWVAGRLLPGEIARVVQIGAVVIFVIILLVWVARNVSIPL